MNLPKLAIAAVLLCAAIRARADSVYGGTTPHASPQTPRASTHITTPELVTRRINDALPRGWKAECGEANITVSRLQKVHLGAYGGMNVGWFAPESTPHNDLGTYRFDVFIEPFISPAEYKKLQAHNEQARKQMADLEQTLEKSGARLGMSFGSDDPAWVYIKTPEQKKMAQQYKELDHSLQRLPQFYYQDISLSSYHYFGVFVREFDPAKKECDDVQAQVLAMLSKYPD